MKIFAIRDETDKTRKDLAWLLYFETSRRFYIELPDGAEPWETPILLASFAREGEYTVNSYWSMVWVRQRIIPPDRQNITQILRDNGLRGYDEYALLMLARGRCAQDDYYLTPIEESDLPEAVRNRFCRKVEDVVPLQNFDLLLFFRDGSVRKCGMAEYFRDNPRFSVLLRNPEYFRHIRIEAGGYGISWDENLTVPDSVLCQMGQTIPLSAEDFRIFVSERVVNAAEAAEILSCSRQYINELVKTDKLHPIKSSGKNTLFLKSEVLKKHNS